MLPVSEFINSHYFVEAEISLKPHLSMEFNPRLSHGTKIQLEFLLAKLKYYVVCAP